MSPKTGPRTRSVSETLDADGTALIVFTYNADPVSHIRNSVTMSCEGPAGPITRTVPLMADGDSGIKETLMRENCVPRR